MTNNPDEIRANIERTRGDLGRDVDALAEKVDPNRIVDRQTERLRSRWTDVRESIFGSDDTGTEDPLNYYRHEEDEQGRMSRFADEAGGAARRAPRTVKRRVRGNPLAAGAIALGAGWLLGSLLPSSRQEQEAAEEVRRRAEPLVDEAKSVARDMGDSLQPQAEQAVADVRQSATESFDRVKTEGQHRVADVQEDTKRAAGNVRDTAQDN